MFESEVVDIVNNKKVYFDGYMYYCKIDGKNIAINYKKD